MCLCPEIGCGSYAGGHPAGTGVTTSQSVASSRAGFASSRSGTQRLLVNSSKVGDWDGILPAFSNFIFLFDVGENDGHLGALVAVEAQRHHSSSLLGRGRCPYAHNKGSSHQEGGGEQAVIGVVLPLQPKHSFRFWGVCC